LDYPRDRFEVMVVDDGGSVPLEPVLDRFCGRMNLTLLRQAQTGPAGARNHGVGKARGEYVAFTDDDCQPEAGWLRALAAAFEESPEAICGGRTVNALPGNSYSTASQLLYDYLYENYTPPRAPGAFFASNNLAVPRKGFLEMGGFDATLRFGEDRDLSHRWASAGRPFRCVPEAVVRHAHILGALSFPRLHLCYGAGTHQFRRRAARRRRPVRLSPLSWYVDLVLDGIRREKGLRGLWLSFLLAVALGTNTAGILWATITGLGEQPGAGREATAE
jgi:GT2 family glycosyltransferase